MSQGGDIEQQILQLEQQRMHAMMDADAETLNRVLALSKSHTISATEGQPRVLPL